MELDKFEALASSLEPHPSRAQILLDLGDDGDMLEKAIAVLTTLGVEPVRYSFVRDEEPSWVLFELQDEDMREAVFKLTEAGFVRLRGMNARPESSG